MIGPDCCAGGIHGYGSLTSGICFVGIAPGRDEVRTGKPFTGQSGKLLDAILETHGIPRTDVYCTNLICHWKDEPTLAEIAICSGRLKRELELVQPKILVALGALATKSLFGMQLSKARGAVINLPNGMYGLSTYHPAACLHKDFNNPDQAINAAYDLVRDLGKLPNIMQGYYAEFEKPTYTLVSDLDVANQVLANMEGPITVDIETSFDKEYENEHPFDHDITCIGIGNNSATAYVLIEAAISPDLVWPDDVSYVFHNGVFDTIEIKRHLNKWLPIGGDTMLASYACDERSIRGLHKLKPLAREFCGADFYEEDEHKTVDAALYQYNANDVVYTHRLDTHLRDWMDREDTFKLYEGLLLPAANMLARSQYRGIYVNPTAVKDLEVEFGYQYLLVQKQIKDLAASLGIPNFNVNSPQQIKAMFASQGIVLASTAKAILDDLDHPFAALIRKFRTLYRLLRVYLLDVEKQIKYDGRVHPHAFLTGTVTGRLTYKDPPMQTLPKPKTVRELGVIRRIFTATNSDYGLMELDYAQIEGFIGAYLSEDDVLMADLLSADWHTATTESLFGVTQADVDSATWAHYRDAGKHINYGSMYRETAHGLTRKPPIGTGFDKATNQALLNKWYARYTKFGLWCKEQERLARDVGEIVTPFGRKRRFPLIVNEHQLRQSVNAPIQSVAGDYTLTSAIKLEPILHKLDTHLLFIEHDALYLEYNKSNEREVAQIAKQVMETPPMQGMPSVRVETAIGDNLAEMIPWCSNCMIVMLPIRDGKFQCSSCGDMK